MILKKNVDSFLLFKLHLFTKAVIADFCYTKFSFQEIKIRKMHNLLKNLTEADYYKNANLHIHTSFF